MSHSELTKTITDIVVANKGILAADESTNTIAKRLQSVQVENTEENRRAYRELLFTTPNLNKYISGIILFEETLTQKTASGVPFSTILAEQNIVVGIKVDKGTIPLAHSSHEKITQGLDGLSERLTQYKTLGARFAKWRGVLSIGPEGLPSRYAIHANVEALARYAAICQSENIVPIVEPEILMDGNHTLERCEQVTEMTLFAVFHALRQHRVTLEHMILKPNMVISGEDCIQQASVEQVAQATLRVLKRTVPAAVPSINFLSGGQSDALATAHLAAIHHLAIDKPTWALSFSYGRALQAAALKAWAGKDVTAGQQALLERCKANSTAIA